MESMVEVSTVLLEQYVSALLLLNLMLGHPTASVPIQKPTPDSIVRMLNEIVRGLYVPTRYFAEGKARGAAKVPPRELIPTQMYSVVVLNARTPETDFASVKNGGVIFEDPVWAVFCAEGISQGHMLGVPIATSEKDLREKAEQLEKRVAASTYKPADFLSPITGFANPTVPSFSFMEVSGAELKTLRAEGLQSFGKSGPKLYVLFEPRSAHH